MKSTNKKILAVLCSSLLIGGVAGLSVLVNKTSAETTAVCEMESEYAFGSTLTVPTAKIRVGEKEIDAQNTFLAYPNGVVKEGTSFDLDEIGEYTVIYSALDQGKTVQAKKTFSVYQNAYTVSTGKSSVEYTEDMQTTKAESDGGLKVTLAEGDTFTYNKVIDLTGKTKDDSFITFAPYSMSARVVKNKQADKTVPLDDPYPLEARYTVVRLTDYYDSQNFVEISVGFYVMNAGTGRLAPCLVTGANGQMKAGLFPSSKASGSRRLVTVDGTQYVAYYGTTDYGAQLDSGMCGTNEAVQEYRDDGDFGIGKTYNENGTEKTVTWPRQSNLLADISNADDYGYSISYDYETKRIYATGKTTYLIADLDDEAIFDQNLFKGFTTGEVILSVSQNEYKTPTATFEIASLGFENGTALNKDKLIDTEAPTITVDTDIEECTVAKGEEFEIFSAKARDVNLYGKVKAYVYFEYGTENQTAVDLKDNKFTPKREGDYTIVYEAKDVYGNTARKQIVCHALTLPNNKRVGFTTEKLSSVKAGEVTVLPEYELVTFDGGAFTKIYYALKGSAKKTPIDETTREFFPRNVGEYEIIYEYGDEVKTYTWSYTLSVVGSSNAYIDKLALPNYLIGGATYTFERVLVETYETKLDYVLPTVYADEDGKGYGTAINYENYTVNAKTSVKFKYEYNGKTIKESEVLPVVEVGYNSDLQMQNYFVGEVEKSADINCVSLTTTKDAEVEFISVLSFTKFATEFAVPKDKANFKGIKITLTDLYDQTNSIYFTYEKDTRGTLFSVNGGEKLLKTNTFADTKRTIEYKANLGAFTDKEGNVYYTENPFTTDKVLLKIEMFGVSGQAETDIYSVANQSLTNKTSESVPAMIIYQNNVGGVRSVGEKIVITPVSFMDVLTPYCTANYTFRVTGPDNKTVVSDEGVELNNPSPYDDYTLTLSKYGRYNVKYTYTDGFGRTLTDNVVITVADRVPPEITLADGYTETTVWQVSKGTKVDLKGYTVKDNVSSNDKISVSVFVISPDNELLSVDINDLSFTANKKGDYKVVYFATDEEGNTNTTYYTVRVK